MTIQENAKELLKELLLEQVAGAGSSLDKSINLAAKIYIELTLEDGGMLAGLECSIRDICAPNRDMELAKQLIDNFLG